MLLDNIIAGKRTEVENLKKNFGFVKLENISAAFPPLRDFRSSIGKPGKLHLIAELKKSSPSYGVIKEDFEPISLARTYEESGASAISVLTESKYFQGLMRYLKSAKESTIIPVLRKDFIIDELQIIESRLAGADALLLILRIISDAQLKNFIEAADKVNLSLLLEVHNEAEVERALLAGAEIIGINNRDLETLKVDFGLSFKLLDKYPELKKKTLVSESGIETKSQINELRAAGFKAVLIGEALLKSKDIGAKIKELFA